MIDDPIDLARFLQGSMKRRPKALSRGEFQAQLLAPHCGDCTDEPCSCGRCFAERYLEQAKTILSLSAAEAFG